jgi:hypothetical protein
MKKRLNVFVMVALAVVFGLVSCEKDETIDVTDSMEIENSIENPSEANFVVRLTDAPADYEEVLIEIKELRIHAAFGEQQESWITLPFEGGVYNLLDFRNGLDTLLAAVELPTGNVSQLRMILGENNKIKVDGEYHDLHTPSAQKSGLKFNINTQIYEGVEYDLWIDFDAARSVVARGNGTYLLKPVIRTFTESSTGSIKGIVLPPEAEPQVMAIAGEDTLSAIPCELGRFMIKGAEPGLYRLEIIPVEGYQQVVLDSTEVIVGKVTDIGTVTLEPVGEQ